MAVLLFLIVLPKLLPPKLLLPKLLPPKCGLRRRSGFIGARLGSTCGSMKVSGQESVE
ncbi:hypothetical protein F0344_27255 [Streptomyces finlayi]|uniref:Uncharacterized protein n=1 Tax=Streptomyces finlayi TaxID=67296 RepID=A0A7G7BR30_9ACTN|nr:hypothetical protein [Streptomyces finlayi]QNE77795.1 hypothetical protein F0344_27255 [Streptomyces finlayi]